MNRVMYLHSKSGSQVGCVVIQDFLESNKVHYQTSVLNPKDTFSREVAQKLARERLQTAPVEVLLKAKASMHDINVAVLKHLMRDHMAPTRARLAARRWLTVHNA